MLISNPHCRDGWITMAESHQVRKLTVIEDIKRETKALPRPKLKVMAASQIESLSPPAKVSDEEIAERKGQLIRERA